MESPLGTANASLGGEARCYLALPKNSGVVPSARHSGERARSFESERANAAGERDFVVGTPNANAS
jgi:hypothetical protein